MMTPNSAVRSIPATPNLEFDRRQAKALLDAVRHGEAEALRRFAVSHPRFASGSGQLSGEVALHDAQLVVAREYGFASWPRWKQFVETRRLDVAERAAAMIRAACSNDVRKARVLLEAEPGLAGADIFAACVAGDVGAVERIVAWDPEAVRRRGGPLEMEPLLYACFSRLLRADTIRAKGIVEVVRVLLAHGADPNVFYWIREKEKWLQSALYGAAGIANHLEMTRMLIEAGARVHAEDKEVLYHTIEFAETGCLRLLLERGEVPVKQVQYCLARATDFEYPEHVRLLLAAGADPNTWITWEGKRTQLHKAVYLSRSLEMVRMLVEGGDVNVIDERGMSVLRSAVLNGREDIAALLRAHGAQDLSITEEDSLRGAPITLCLAAARDDLATIDRLLDAGAAVNGGAAPDGSCPLDWAAWRGRLKALKRLVERGADIHRKNSYGGDALGMAVHGSANCFDTEGGPGMKTPEEAVKGEYAEMVKYLLERGAKVPRWVDGGSEAVQEILRAAGVRDREE